MVEFDDMADDVCTTIAETLKRKNHDYGDSFQKSYEKYGNPAPLLRMEDKLNRLYNLMMKSESKVDESIDDTLLDLAGYAVLTIITRMRCSEQSKKI